MTDTNDGGPPNFKAWCHVADDQDETGRTTYTVILAHMDHGVTVHQTEDRNHASALRFVIRHELVRAYEMGMLAERERAGGEG